MIVHYIWMLYTIREPRMKETEEICPRSREESRDWLELNLAKRPEDYKWSSASFYEDGVDSFGLLTHYHEYFG